MTQLMQSDVRDPVTLPVAHRSLFQDFCINGFTILPTLIPPEVASTLCERLDTVLRSGAGDIGEPDKAPPCRVEGRSKPGKRRLPVAEVPSRRTLQVINIWKADSIFRSVVLSPLLGQLVADLAGWESGARVVNDQVWAKPPGASPLTFHRDSAYFDLVPADIVTVWIALDNMDEEVGPLQYVKGSHLWKDERCGGTSEFFLAERDHRWMMLDAYQRQKKESAATEAGEKEPEQEKKLHEAEDGETGPHIVTIRVNAGGCGIHNGRLWHGSDRNASVRARRGLGIHFCAADARFRDSEGRTQAHLVAAKYNTIQTEGADAENASEDTSRIDEGASSEDDCVLPKSLFPITYSR